MRAVLWIVRSRIRVAAESCFERLVAEDVVELFFQRVEVRDRWCGRDAVVVRVLLVLRKSKYVPRYGVFLRAAIACWRHGEDRNTGRQRDSFLHAGETNVEPPVVEAHRNAGQRRPA